MSQAAISVYTGDITKMGVDAIVNAANPSLLGGGGVDGAIHLAAGPALKEACRKLNGCAVGEAKLTPGFELPANYVIHTVGPIFQGGSQNEAQKLAACYTNSLRLAVEHDLATVAFPAISTGVYGYPKQPAARIACAAIKKFLEQPGSLQKIYLVAFDTSMAELYNSILSDCG